MSNLYDSYLLAPVLVNWLVLQQWLLGTMQLNGVFNILFNLLIFYEIYFLGKRVFNRPTAMLGVTFYALLYSTWTSAWPTATEVPFLALCLSGVSLALSRRWWGVLLAGVLLGVGNGIRGVAVVYLPTIMGLMLWRKARVGEMALGLLAMGAIVIATGCWIEARTGYFHVTSTTSGLNMLISANDKADGSLPTDFCDTTLTDMRIDNEDGLNYAAKDSAWTARSTQWIKAHPGRWAGLAVKKLGIMYFHDVTFDAYINPNYDGGYMSAKKEEKSYWAIIGERVPKSLVYYAVITLVIMSLWRHRHELLAPHGECWKYGLTPKGYLLLIPIVGTLATLAFQTMARYHYPFLPVMCLWAAYYFTRPSREDPAAIREKLLNSRHHD